MLKTLLREPVLHFLLAGLVLYLLTSWLQGDAPQEDDERRIVVDRASLLTYMQYQSNAFDTVTFEAALDRMDASTLQQLTDQYIIEEVLYREARALGLERSDYIIRQRMVDKMRFLLTDLAGEEQAPDDGVLKAWLDDNRELYRIQPSATFTHVFVDGSTAQAAVLQQELNSAGVGFNEAGGYGDRFPFLRNYVERTLDFVAGHFGTGFATALQQLQPDAGQWQGPLPSAYGQHLVLLTALQPARDPQLAEVRADVLRDYLATRNEARLRELVDNVRAQYRIETTELRRVEKAQAAAPESAGD